MKPLMIQLFFPPAPTGVMDLPQTLLWEDIVFCEDVFDAVATALKRCRERIELPDITTIGIENHILAGYGGDYEDKPIFTAQFYDPIGGPFEFWPVYQRHQEEFAPQLLAWAESHIDDAHLVIRVVDQMVAEGGPDYRPLVMNLKSFINAKLEQVALGRVPEGAKRKPKSRSL